MPLIEFNNLRISNYKKISKEALIERSATSYIAAALLRFREKSY